jgi:hypothetical protein
MNYAFGLILLETSLLSKFLEGLKMNQRKELVLFLAIIFLSSAVTVSGVSASSHIATVKKVSGTATVIRQETPYRLPSAWPFGGRYDPHGSGGSIGIVFNDDTFLSLGRKRLDHRRICICSRAREIFDCD